MSKEAEYHRISESIRQLRDIAQIKPTSQWIDLFEKHYQDVDDANNLRMQLYKRVNLSSVKTFS